MAFDATAVGGLGSGVLGNVTLSTSVQINSYANVMSISADGKTLTISSAAVGIYNSFISAESVMFHVSGCLGSETADRDKYAFGVILTVNNGTQITLDTAMPIIDLTKYVCQLVTVPMFDNLTVNAQISAKAYDVDKKYGGILIAKVKGKCDITNGMWLTEGKGIPTLNRTLKPAGIIRSNTDLKNYWSMNPGNGIAVIIANEYTDSSASRIGATWSGTLGAGRAGTNSGDGTGGHWTAGESASGVKGGRGGELDGNFYGGSAMTEQGYAGNGSGNGSGNDNGSNPAYAGATVVLLINNFLKLSQEAISTGGQGGQVEPGISAEHIGGNGGAGFGGGGGATGIVCFGLSGGGAGYCLVATNSPITVPYANAFTLDTVTSLSSTGSISFTGKILCKAPNNVIGWRDGISCDGYYKLMKSGSNVGWHLAQDTGVYLIKDNNKIGWREIQVNVLSIDTVSLPDGNRNVPYSTTLAASKGTGTYSWSASGLPTGLTINPTTGIISGIPTANGISNVTITVTSAGLTANKVLSLSIVIPSYTITWNPEGGIASEATRVLPQGSIIGTLPTIDKVGSTFGGWFTAEVGGLKIDANYSINGNVTFYARWGTTTDVVFGDATSQFNVMYGGAGTNYSNTPYALYSRYSDGNGSSLVFQTGISSTNGTNNVTAANRVVLYLKVTNNGAAGEFDIGFHCDSYVSSDGGDAVNVIRTATGLRLGNAYTVSVAYKNTAWVGYYGSRGSYFYTDSGVGSASGGVDSGYTFCMRNIFINSNSYTILEVDFTKY